LNYKVWRGFSFELQGLAGFFCGITRFGGVFHLNYKVWRGFLFELQGLAGFFCGIARFGGVLI
jgi:hypothetical protein